MDNGSEFAGEVMERWAYESGVELDVSRRSAPTENALVESFNGRLRQEVSERALVLVTGRRTEKNRRVAALL